MSEFYGIRDGHCARFFVEYTVAAIVVKCWSNVKPFMTAIIPGASCGCFAMDEYAATRWSQWCGIKVERTKKVFPSRECQVAVAGTEEVQCEFCMWDAQVPPVCWEVGSCSR